MGVMGVRIRSEAGSDETAAAGVRGRTTGAAGERPAEVRV